MDDVPHFIRHKYSHLRLFRIFFPQCLTIGKKRSDLPSFYRTPLQELMSDDVLMTRKWLFELTYGIDLPKVKKLRTRSLAELHAKLEPRLKKRRKNGHCSAKRKRRSA